MSGIRDFIIHMLTITLGLLIALGLEAAVEAAHHRHQRREAEATICAELRNNREQIVQLQTLTAAEMKNMVAALNFIQARLKDPAAMPPGGLDISFHEGPLQDAAWRTAVSTGVLSYMDYAQVEKFSIAYKEQEQLELVQQQALDAYLSLDSFIIQGFDPKHLSKDDLTAALPVVRLAIAHLGGMRDVSNGALQTYDEALK